MKNLDSKQTQKNLEAAFAGEAMANRKYLYFAKIARQLKDETVAELFEKTAHEETAHAFSHLELIYPPAEMTVEKLLSLAIEGELYETEQMYPNFEAVARAEGEEEAAREFQEQKAESKAHANIFIQAAKRFAALGLVEAFHARRYQKMLAARKAGA